MIQTSVKLNDIQKVVSNIHDNGFKVKYCPFEIGSRGYITKDNMNRIKTFIREVAKDIKANQIKLKLCKIKIVSSFIVI